MKYAWLLTTLALAACSSSDTALLLVVKSNLTNLTAIEIAVAKDTTATPTERSCVCLTASCQGDAYLKNLPLEGVLEPGNQSSSPFVVAVRAHATSCSDTPTLEERATVVFVPGQHLEVELDLNSVCVGVVCDQPGETCDSTTGECKSDNINVTDDLATSVGDLSPPPDLSMPDMTAPLITAGMPTSTTSYAVAADSEKRFWLVYLDADAHPGDITYGSITSFGFGSSAQSLGSQTDPFTDPDGLGRTPVVVCAARGLTSVAYGFGASTSDSTMPAFFGLSNGAGSAATSVFVPTSDAPTGTVADVQCARAGTSGDVAFAWNLDQGIDPITTSFGAAYLHGGTFSVPDPGSFPPTLGRSFVLGETTTSTTEIAYAATTPMGKSSPCSGVSYTQVMLVQDIWTPTQASMCELALSPGRPYSVTTPIGAVDAVGQTVTTELAGITSSGAVAGPPTKEVAFASGGVAQLAMAPLSLGRVAIATISSDSPHAITLHVVSAKDPSKAVLEVPLGAGADAMQPVRIAANDDDVVLVVWAKAATNGGAGTGGLVGKIVTPPSP